MRFCFKRLWILAFAAASLAGQNTAPLNVSPGALFFRNPTGTAITQTITVASGKTGVSLGSFTATVSTTFTGTWLTVTSDQTSVTVKANPAGLANGVYTGSVSIAAAGFATQTVPVVLSVLPLTGGSSPVPAPALIASPDNVSVQAVQAGPAGLPPVVQLTNPNGQGYDWTSSANVTWLSLNPSTGHGDTAVRVVANPQGFAAGTYTGIVTIASGSLSAKIAVTFTVAASRPAQLTLSPQLLTFVTDGSATARSKLIQLTNSGNTPLTWSAVSSTVSAGGGTGSDTWLSISPLTGSSTAGQQSAGQIAVTVSPGTLAPGLYSGSVTVTSGATRQVVPVTLRVGKLAATVSKHELLFYYSLGSAQPASNTFTIAGGPANTGFTVTPTTTSGGNWMTVTPLRGVVGASSTITATIQTGIANQLTPGAIYYGQIVVNTPGASQESTTVRVVLKVFGATDTARLRLDPGGLVFQANQGSALVPPSAVTVTLSGNPPAITTAGFQVNTAVSTNTGGNWLSVNPNVALVTPSAPLQVSVQVSAAGLLPGTYSGVIAFTPISNTLVPPAFLRIFMVVTSRAPAGDTPALPVTAGFTSPFDNFITQPELPNTVTVAVLDANGNPLPGATVTIHPTNGDPDLILSDMTGGLYGGQLRSFHPGPQTLIGSATFFSTATGVLLSNDFILSGSMEPAQAALVEPYPGGVVNAASFAAAPTPIGAGSLASMFGQGVAGTGGAASKLPLPTQLGGSSVAIGGIAAPLVAAVPSASGDQINLQVPFELEGQTTAEVVTTVNTVIAPIETILLGPVPAVFTTTQNGSGPAAALHSNFTAVTAASPAAAGETISIFATGLGPLNEAVTTGAAAPGSTSTKLAVTATIGGKDAPVAFAGLAPGFAGLYQVNAQVPAGAGTGSVVLQLFVAGYPSTGNSTISLK